MLASQKHLFSLSEEITYLNCATMAPQLKTVEKIGIENLQKKSNPQQILSTHFFTERAILKQRFAELINAPNENSIAIIPSVSYGIANAAKNIPFEKGDEVVVLEDQFPSNFYTWKDLEIQKGVILKTVASPTVAKGRGKLWNESILTAINSKTKVVAIPNIHWTDGTLFDLKKIRARTNEVGAYLIIDGTQSVGALPISIAEIEPDALICAGYKWLMGAYGLGLAYYGERFHKGRPIENNWINHEDSENFTNLVNYNENFKPMATRYDVGESSSFILIPMLSEAIRQLLVWTPRAIQAYCKKISEDPLTQIKQMGYFVESSEYRAHHMFGIYLSDPSQLNPIKAKLIENNIVVSYRGNAIRIAPNVYNSAADIEKLVSCFI